MKKKILIITGVLAGIILLSAAAFLAARLLSPGQLSTGALEGPGLIKMGGGGGNAVRVQSKLNLTPAKEVPARKPDMNGAVSEIKDNSLMVTRVEGVTATKSEGGEVKMDMETSGPAVEVVVTRETQIYLETTFANRTPEEGPPSEEETIQQTVEPASLSDIDPDTMVTVWGYKRGDRLVAEVILFNQPFLMKKAK